MFELPSDTFQTDFTGGDLGTIRLLYYPGHLGQSADLNAPQHSEMREGQGQHGDESDTGISAHTDFEVFTLMHQDATGLQFLLPESREWVDAPVRQDAFVVIVGDILERFTNGALRATPHRVLPTPHARRSIIRFNALAPEALIQPLPQFVTPENPAQYTPVTMRRHMETTLKNLKAGIGAWDSIRNISKTATYVYSD